MTPHRSRHQVWAEDDATVGTAGHETVRAAFRRLSGRELDPAEALSREDGGDGELLLLPGGWQVWWGYPGSSTISRIPCGEDCP